MVNLTGATGSAIAEPVLCLTSLHVPLNRSVKARVRLRRTRGT